MKKLATVVLSCLLMFCLVACSSGGSGSTSSADTSSSSVSSASDETSATTEESSTDLGNVLVVYYSATGNTERVANSIAEATGGDLFEIEPTEPYTDDDLNWNDESSRVSREYEDESLRDVPLVNTTVDGWDDYDTVFIGYPIWWGIAAWPVDGFVEANDFSDKTVIHLPPPQVPAWDRAANYSQTSRVPAIGRMVCDSPAALVMMRCRNGSKRLRDRS